MAVHEKTAREATARADGPAAIVCSGLTKDYGQRHGIFDLDLVIDRGETFGFIGPNGAGKTTTIRLLMDLIRPTRGRAAVLGLDTARGSLAIKRRVGYLPGELAEFPGVTAGYVIGLLAGLRGGVDPDRISALAERFQIDLGRKYETLSHGNKQKVGLIQAFMHEPELLILDEPTNGPDPLMQREFHLLVQESVTRGATVFLSSHVLSEVELICDRIGLIRDGRLLGRGRWRISGRCASTGSRRSSPGGSPRLTSRTSPVSASRGSGITWRPAPSEVRWRHCSPACRRQA